MPAPLLDIDQRHFEILASSERVVLTRHRVTGNLTVWKLDWREHSNLPGGFSAEAWAHYMRLSMPD